MCPSSAGYLAEKDGTAAIFCKSHFKHANIKQCRRCLVPQGGAEDRKPLFTCRGTPAGAVFSQFNMWRGNWQSRTVSRELPVFPVYPAVFYTETE